MKKILCFLFVFAFSIISISQTIKIGDWSIHPSYTDVNVITSGNNKVYVGTVSGLFIYSGSDGSLTVFSKLDGLNSLDITALTYSNNSLLIGYRDGNLDIIKNNVVVNVPDIKYSSILGSKHINNIFVDNELAYLSCSFGLVIYDMVKSEVKETCYFYANGAHSEVYQTYVFNQEVHSSGDSFLANKIFAGTGSGLFYANKNANLLDYTVWKNDSRYSLSKKDMNYTELGNAEIKQVVGIDLKKQGGKKLIIATDLSADEYNLFSFNTAAYSNSFSTDLNVFQPIQNVSGSIININHNSNAGKIVVTAYDDEQKIIILNELFETISSLKSQDINNVDFDFPLSIITGVVLDDYNSSKQLVLADLNSGCFLVENSSNNFSFLELVSPNGPASVKIGIIDSYGDNLLFTHGGKTTSWNNADTEEEISFFTNQYWETSDTLLELGFKDAVSGCAAPNNKFFVGTWNDGLLEFQNNKLINHFTPENTEALESIPVVLPNIWSRVGGVDLDNNNNLWLTNSQTTRPLIKFSLSNKNWTSFSVPNLSTNTMSGKILCASNGYKWIQLKDEGLIIAREEAGGIVSKKLGELDGLASSSVNCFEEDDNGAVWIGTSQGLSIIYVPSEVFNNSAYTAEHILIETEDGYVERLFNNVEILDIKVDGGNRKWVATKNNGVFLVSEDGSEQIRNFTKESSPLLDNAVYGISVIEASGEVFFATAKGLCSYRSDATESQVGFENVMVFPNPVKKDYLGKIAISGLSNATNVKITDISGNLVFETISLGGTAIWDGKRFNGEKVKTGVYLFLCTSEDFESSIVKKVLIYN